MKKYFALLETAFSMGVELFNVRLTRVQKVLITVLAFVFTLAVIKFEISLIGTKILWYTVEPWMAVSEMIGPVLGLPFWLGLMWKYVPEPEEK